MCLDSEQTLAIDRRYRPSDLAVHTCACVVAESEKDAFSTSLDEDVVGSLEAYRASREHYRARIPSGIWQSFDVDDEIDVLVAGVRPNRYAFQVELGR